MGFLKAFGNLVQAGIQTAVLPLDIVKDVVTLGGVATDDESAIVKRLRNVAEELEDAYDELDED